MWKDYLSFLRQEQRGFLFLAVIIILLVIYRLVAPFFITTKQIVITREDSLFFVNDKFSKENTETISLKENIPLFNPNKVSHSFLIEIGIKERTAINWINYLKKGGSFKTVYDVGKVYGVDSVILESLIPYMFIKEVKNVEDDSRGKGRIFFTDLNRISQNSLVDLGWEKSMIDTLETWITHSWIDKKYDLSRLREWNADSLHALRIHLISKMKNITSDPSFVLEMNSADTSEWMLLDGIGPVLSKRIVLYRRKLGGFVSPDQLLEVYGISPVLVDDIRKYLSVDSLKVSTIDINKASIRQLRDHPYLGFYKAKALIDERKKRGCFSCTTDLLELPLFNDKYWEKLLPYLSVK